MSGECGCGWHYPSNPECAIYKLRSERADAVQKLDSMSQKYNNALDRQREEIEQLRRRHLEAAEAARVANLQVESLRKALDRIGNFDCIDWGTGGNDCGGSCPRCLAVNALKGTENRVDVPECGNCGGDLVRKTEPTWICQKCEL